MTKDRLKKLNVKYNLLSLGLLQNIIELPRKKNYTYVVLVTDFSNKQPETMVIKSQALQVKLDAPCLR